MWEHREMKPVSNFQNKDVDISMLILITKHFFPRNLFDKGHKMKCMPFENTENTHK